jgi:leucyl-tRNA synthetase
MGPLADSKPWNPRDIPGCRRFVDRVWRLFVDEESDAAARLSARAAAAEGEPEGAARELERELARALARVDDAFTHFNLNTAIAALMTFVNEATRRQGALTFSQAERFLRALAPFAPHLAEELWERIGQYESEGSIGTAAWPAPDARYLVDETFDLVVQVGGKLRARVPVPADAGRDDQERIARAAVAEQLAGREELKVVVVPGRLVNFVVR